MNKYTVVGFYAENKEPWVSLVEAESPKHAEKAGVQSILEKSTPLYPLCVVAVFEGHVEGNQSKDEVSTWSLFYD